MTDINETTFIDLCNGSDSPLARKIIIPEIQRDYAQGRKNADITRIRQRFLKSICDGLQNNENGVFLDFIYGDIDEATKAFYPLDGQQRLTTLFLLHLYAALKDGIDEEQYKFLNNFSYEIRPSSKNFCRELVSKFKVIKLEKGNIENQIIEQVWFHYEWKNDPTINSMLVMLDAIHSDFYNFDNLWEKLVTKKMIKFNFLELQSNNLTDDLYIKMNSRGKPLTRYEHFKSELIGEVKKIDLGKADELGQKFDVDWTNYFWSKKDRDDLIDDYFLNYFKYFCDVLTYEEGHTPENRKGIKDNKDTDIYNEFYLIETFFNHNDKERLIKNLDLLERYFNCFLEYDRESQTSVFKKYLATESDGEKARVFDIDKDIDLFKSCLKSYVNLNKNGEEVRGFTFKKFILLYAFIQYLTNKKDIYESDFQQRIRIINNLINQSENEMSDSELRRNALPSILIQTKSIITCGRIMSLEEIKNENTNISFVTEKGPSVNNFNDLQLKEEKKKLDWKLKENDDSKLKLLNKLEDHNLLRGQIDIIGLENIELFKVFLDLFIENNYAKIAKAMLTFGDYSRNNSRRWWRRVIGTGNGDSWREVFRKHDIDSSDSDFWNTQNILISFLSRFNQKDSVSYINELELIMNEYTSKCKADKEYDWRYYFINYNNFITDLGKYAFNHKTEDGKHDHYSIQNLTTKTKYTTNSYQSYLYLCDKGHVFKEARGEFLKYDDKYIDCDQYGFHLKVTPKTDAKILASINIPQINGIDKVDRIEVFKEYIKDFLQNQVDIVVGDNN